VRPHKPGQSRPARSPAEAKPARSRPAPPAARPQRARETHWENVADWYDTLVGHEGSEFHQHVVLPGVTRLLAAKAGESVIDVACGQGVLCRLLRHAGVTLTGVDASPALIEAARQRGPGDIRYDIGDARDLSFLPEASFDAAACVLAIQNMHPIRPVFESIRRVLRPWGRLVIVMMHPAFRGPKETSWGWDDEAKVQYRRVDRYLVPRKTPIVAHPGSAPGVYTWSFHKPLELYFKALRQAGMLVDALEEWPSHKTSDSGPRAPAENVARKEIPMFLALRAYSAQRPGSEPAETGSLE
jgi:ubiquinone/menaquinone biosynthesis C-methylase UbiE